MSDDVEIDWDSLTAEYAAEEPITDDVPEIPDVPDDWPRCEVCAAPVTWSGRGRKPKKCDEHKRVTGARSTAVRTRRSTKQTDRLEVIQGKLVSQGVKTGALLSRLAPYTGLYLANRSEKVASALVSIAADKPQLLEALEQVAEFEAYFEIAEFVGGLIIAGGVDMGRIHPESFPARFLGVTEIHEMLADDEQQHPATYEEPESVARPNGNYPQFGPGKLPEFTPIGDVG